MRRCCSWFISAVEDLCNLIEGLLDLMVNMREFMRFIIKNLKDFNGDVSFVIIDCTLGNRKEGRDDRNRFCDSGGVRFRNVATQTAVVFGGWSYIPAILTMKCPGGTFCGLVVDDQFGVGWQKGMPVEVMCALEVCVG